MPTRLALSTAAMLAVLLSRDAHAYVDPGIIGALYQMAYVALFGVLATIIFKPWAYLKSKFRRTGEERSREDVAGKDSEREEQAKPPD